MSPDPNFVVQDGTWLKGTGLSPGAPRSDRRRCRAISFAPSHPIPWAQRDDVEALRVRKGHDAVDELVEFLGVNPMARGHGDLLYQDQVRTGSMVRVPVGL